MKKVSLSLLLLVFCACFSFGQNNISGPIVQYPVYFDVSPPLRDMVKYPPKKADISWKDGVVKNKFNIRPRPKGQEPGGLSDPGLQIMNGTTTTDTTIVNFDGNTNTQGYVPPDTYGDVGPNHYFQVVNCHYSIYSKTGTLLLGPLDNSSVWSGMPNNENDGDAVVVYDDQADRWLFSQFSLPNASGPFYQMIAVSTTPDPTGTWYRWQYSFTYMDDYPKLAVWPDGYYMSAHLFTSTSGSYAGIMAAVFNRTQMLAGNATPTMVTFTKPNTDEAFGWLPSDCDGPFPPGTPPNYYLYAYDGTLNDHLGIYEFHVDWNNTANSTFANFLSLPVTAFTSNITGIPQPGTNQKLDVINDRMMYRLQYRHFSDHEAMVCNHTVDISSTVAGIRWYELRKTTGAWSIYQSGTYSPADNNSRWMGSIAQDSSGNMALGYSVSGASLYPSIRYCGRKKNDALGTMSIAERGIFIGTGSQTTTYDRWGDYSSMTCDPSAKATYWYTQEYYATTSDRGWKTRIASFRFNHAPSVATQTATSITITGGTLNGTINPNGLATTYHFEWGTTPSYGNNTPILSAGSGTSDVPVSAVLSSLTTGVTYHYRIDGTNSDGTSNGLDMTFTPGGAIVVTTAASAITATTATAGGNVTTDGGSSVTARGTCWGTTANPTISGSHTTDGTGTGVFTSSLTGLTGNTTYHIRAYATNANSTIYGSDLTFTTLCGIYSVPFNESFSTTSIPGCWSQVDNSGNGQIWQFGTITGYPGYIPNLTGNYAYLNSDGYGNNNSQNADLVTPLLNLTGFTNITLQFNHYFRWYDPSSGTLSYSINNGSTWTTIATFTTTTANPATFNQVIAALAGQSQVKIKWNYTGTYAYYWAIDNVQITGTCSTTYPVSISIAPSSNPVCSGTSVNFTATPTNGGTTPSYQWKVNAINVGTNSATYSYTPVNNDAVTCVLTSNANCITGNPATSNIVTMSVGPLLSVGSISANQVICVNTTPAQLLGVAPLNGTSPTYQWQNSLNNSTFNNISGATMLNYQPGSLSVTTYYRQLQNATGTCGGPLPTNTITITVNPILPVSISIAPSANPVCAGTSVILTATPTNGGTTPSYQWKVNAVNVGTNSPTYSYTPVNTDAVTCVLTSNATCTTGNPATSNIVTMTVNTIPTITGTTPGSRCGTGTVTLGATASAGTINWYAASTGGSSLGTGTSFTTPSISVTTPYYADATANGCTTASRTAVTATVNAIPTITGTTPGSRCGAGTVNLGATASAGTINWYAASTGGSSLGTGTSFTTPSISVTTPYYADATANGCTTASRTAITATVNTIPTITGTTPGSRCGTGTVTLGATASAGTINWYAAFTGGSSLGTGTSFTTPSISVTTPYYADATANGCTTDSRTAVTATVNAIPTITGTTPGSRCGTGTVTLGATASAGTINWYAASTGGSSLGTGTSFTTPTISVTTPYYTDATANGCTTDLRTAVTATVNAIPTITGTTPGSRCGTGTVNLGATASAGTINWYAASTGGSSLGAGTSFTTPSISVTTAYYADATANGCTTDSRTAVIATVNPFPDQPGTISGPAPICQNTTNTYSISDVSGATSYTWTLPSGWSGSSTTTSIDATADTTTGSITVTANNSCGPGPAQSKRVPVVIIPAQVSVTDITVLNGQNNCYTATQNITVAGNNTTFIISNGGSVTMIAGQTISYLPGASVDSGGYMHGYIATGVCCGIGGLAPSIVENHSGIDSVKILSVPGLGSTYFKVYPNPTSGNFILELNGDFASSVTTVEVYGMQGEKVLSTVLTGEQKHEFSLSDRPAGIYFIRVSSGSKASSAKIIKQ